MNATERLKLLSLYCTEGGSDKQYTIWIEEAHVGYVVQAQWGPRGGSIQSGRKTPEPVSLEKAEKVYDKVVKEKLAKGYHAGEDAPAFSQVDGAVDSGLRPMLLTADVEESIEKYVEDPGWAAQEKMNGKRIMVRAAGGKVIGVNRKGLECPIPEAISKTFKLAAVTLDGEMIGDVYHVFDALEIHGKDMTMLDTEARHRALSAYHREYKWWTEKIVRLVPLVFGPDGKRSLISELRDRRREGVVFKKVDATYEPGKVENLKKATMVKVKFYSEATLMILGWTDRSSIRVGAFSDDNKIVLVGNVTVPEKYVAQVNEALGSVTGRGGPKVRVRYLYATPNYILYQPTLDPDDNGCVIRDDVNGPDLRSSLKLEGVEE